MTTDKARYEITVEGDSYEIAEWENMIQENSGDLDVEVERCEVE